MKYALGALGPHEFESMVRALCVQFIGPGITVFGSGPDGGREASYTGSFKMTTGETWTGHTVIQAKFRLTERDPADNLNWLRDQMSAELKHWGDRPPSAGRARCRTT